MDVIAFYLPQFHTIPENDEWWGKGFTEWTNVKKTQPLFEGHRQPRIPLNKDYYDLSDVNVIRRQTELAKSYGISGFCFYHYWFDGHLLLEKPVEQYLENADIDFPFCLCWANEQWTNAWVSGENKVLIKQKYGDENNWRKHFEYLLPFFKDSRYMKKDGKLIFIIYRPELISDRKKMLNYWNNLALENGLPGFSFMYQRPDCIMNDPNIDMSMFDYCIEYQPYTAFISKGRKKNAALKRIKGKLATALEKYFHFSAANIRLKTKKPNIRNYDDVWNFILKEPPLTKNSIACAFVDWDNTPRRNENGSVMEGANPSKFKIYFKELIEKSKKEFQKDVIFVFSWNEWAEGGYLEPDEENGYGYLEAIHEVLLDVGEYPENF